MQRELSPRASAGLITWNACQVSPWQQEQHQHEQEQQHEQQQRRPHLVRPVLVRVLHVRAQPAEHLRHPRVVVPHVRHDAVVAPARLDSAEVVVAKNCLRMNSKHCFRSSQQASLRTRCRR